MDKTAFWQRLEEAEKETRQRKGRIGWFCSYTPVEIISSCGLLPYRLSGKEGTTLYADSFLHSSLCFFVRGCLEKVLKEEKDLEGAVLVNSCLAMSHLHNALQKYSSLAFTYLLDLPRHAFQPAVEYWAQGLRKFHRALCEYRGIEVNEKASGSKLTFTWTTGAGCSGFTPGGRKSYWSTARADSPRRGL